MAEQDIQPYLITLHGLDEPDPLYSQALYKTVSAQINCTWLPLHVEPLLAVKDNWYLNKIHADPSYKRCHLKLERDFLANFVGDLWQFQGAETQQILDSLLEQLATAKVRVPAHLALHSWGTCVFFDSRFSAFRYNRAWASVTTLACPVGLYSISGETPDLLCQNWHNFWHSDDIIGTPMSQFGSAVDHEVTDSGPPDCLVGGAEVLLAAAAHNCFWESKQVANHIAATMRKPYNPG